jgi:thioredoxin-like negative regulator of GroEL
MATLTEIQTEDSFDQTIKAGTSSTLFILYFHTPWAAPCAQMNTILTALASTYPADAPIKFLSINAEELPDISEAYDVTAVPFLVLQRDGKTLETVSGSDANKVRTTVEKYAGGQTKSANGIPPQLQATPQHQQANGSPDSSAPTATKDLSSYAPKSSDPPTAPALSSTEESQEELNERLGKLVKAA